VPTREVIFSDEMLPGQGFITDYPCPLEGKIVTVIRQWPEGSDGLVDIAVGHTGTWLLPNLTDKYVALNDTTVVLTDMDEPVYKGEQLWVRVRNRDGGFPHTPSVTIVVEGTEVSAARAHKRAT
jgi:hypothetical protein